MSESQTLHALSRNTISLIGSCQVITSVFSVVKELVENSLDANASSVDIKLEDFGLERTEVSDNGSGIKAVDVPFMGKRHFTSKITKSEDLDSLTTYGFRGEAVGSLCAVSNVTITTKTAEDQLSYVYTIGPDGYILDKKPSHNGKGTVVSSKNLFHNVPVRKQYYNGSQRKKEDLKRIEHLLMMYAIVKPDLRLTLKHGKDLVFQKTALKDIKTALHSVLGRQVSNQMLYKEKCCEELQIKVSAFLPKPGSDVKDMSLASSDKTFIAVNKRPVSVSELNKVLKSYYSNCHGLDTYRHPVCFVSIDVATNQIDVNVDPNKTKVFFQQKADIIKALEEILVEIYGPLENVPSWHYREADDEKETSKGAADTPASKGPQKTFRPFITYSKRPGDEETTNESSDSNINGTSVQGQDSPTSKDATSLSASSLNSPSKPSDEITTTSCSGEKSTSLEESLNSTSVQDSPTSKDVTSLPASSLTSQSKPSDEITTTSCSGEKSTSLEESLNSTSVQDSPTSKDVTSLPASSLTSQSKPSDEITTTMQLSEKSSSCVESRNENGTSVQDNPTSNNATSLPSFSLTFHSIQSDEIPTTTSCSGEKSTSCEELLNKNITDPSVKDVHPPSNKDVENDNGSTGKNTDCDKTDSNIQIQTSKEGTNADSGGELIDSSKADNTVNDDVLKGESVKASKDNNCNEHSPLLQSETVVTGAPVQEVTVIEDIEMILAEMEKGLLPTAEPNESAALDQNGKSEDNQMSVPDISPSDWSKGNLTVGNTLLQPVKLLPPSSAHRPGKRPSSPSKVMESSQPKRKAAKLNILSNQATLFDVMKTQSIKKPESPLSHFIQEKSPELSQEFPDEDAAALAERLTEEWENMTNDERVAYREKCWYDTKRYEKDKMSLSSQCEAKSTSGKELVKPVKRTTYKLKKTLKRRLYCKECPVKIPMNKIRNPEQEQTTSTEDGEPTIIGPAHQSDDVWLCSLQNKIFLVNVWRLAEVSLYKKLKSEHKLPFQPCDPIALDSSAISDQGMLVLKSLAKKCQGTGTYFHISDERLVANGFDVKCHIDSNGNLMYELVGISDVVPTYNVKDLNSVLGVISGDEDASLSQTRTLKVAYYLQSEAVRMTRHNAGKKTSHEVQTLLRDAGNKTSQPCLHHKPIFQELFDLSSEQLDGD